MNILIVDDEPLMRGAYSKIIDWEANGFNLVGSARSGADALELMRQNHVDIVITDLKMPHMSGLELIKCAKDEFPSVKFVVMSGFNDFHLVKEAFKLGVKEYFLKIEIDPDEILKVITNISKEIELERRATLEKNKELQEQAGRLDKTAQLESIIHRSHKALQEKLLKELVWNSASKSLLQRMKESKIFLDETFLCVITVTITDYYSEEEKSWQGERELFKYAILNVIDEICTEAGKTYSFSNLPDEYVIVYSVLEQNISGRELFENISCAIKRCFGLESDGGFSGPLNGYGNLKRLYKESKSACKYCFVKGHGKLVVYNDIREPVERVNTYGLVKDLKRLLMSMDSTEIKQRARELRISPESVGYDQVDEVKNLFYLCSYEIGAFATENDINNQIAEEFAKYDLIKNTACLSELNSWLVSCVCCIADILKSGRAINKAKSYIKNHYSEHITLYDLSRELEISEKHLSRMFKKDGESFMQYLLKTRMDAAMDLMKNSNLKIYEIAQRVGFTSAEQFSRMFKKVVGKSPKDFYNH